MTVIIAAESLFLLDLFRGQVAICMLQLSGKLILHAGSESCDELESLVDTHTL